MLSTDLSHRYIGNLEGLLIPSARLTASGTADPSLALIVWRHSIRPAAVSAEGRLAVVAGGREVSEGRESSIMEGGCTRLRLSHRLPARLACSTAALQAVGHYLVLPFLATSVDIQAFTAILLSIS
jgi:hypothetical protein